MSELSPLSGSATNEATVELTDQDSTKLRNWNLKAAVFHLVTGITIFIISNTSNTTPVYSSYANPDTRGNPELWAPKLEKLGDTVVGYYSGAFLIVVAIDHFAVATIFRETYEYYLRRGQNPFRWVEYSISAGIMHIEIAALSGVMDVHVLFSIFILTSITMIFGHFQEIMSWRQQGKPELKSLFAFWMGFIPHAANWGIICSYFFYGVSKGDPPAFVWAIIFILFFLDLSFAINQYYQQKEIRKWANYLYGEYVFIILSATAKQLLAWLNFGGTNALSSDANVATTPVPN